MSNVTDDMVLRGAKWDMARDHRKYTGKEFTAEERWDVADKIVRERYLRDTRGLLEAALDQPERVA